MQPLDDRPWYRVELQRRDGRSVVVCCGELDLDATDELWDCLEKARAEGPVTLDLAGVTFMDSSGINLLLRAYAAHGRVPGAVTLRSPSEAVRRTLEMTGIEGVFRIDEAPGLASAS